MSEFKQEHGIPEAASFVETDRGICIGDIFGGTWCSDYYDEDADVYHEAAEVYGAAAEPITVQALCEICQRVLANND